MTTEQSETGPLIAAAEMQYRAAGEIQGAEKYLLLMAAEEFAKKATHALTGGGSGGAGECLILGVLLCNFRRPREALKVLEIGLEKPASVAERAALHMQVAKVCFMLKKRTEMHQHLSNALALREAVESYRDENGVRGLDGLTDDERFAHWTFTIVLTKAFVLSFLVGKKADARDLYEKARAWALDPQCGSTLLFKRLEDLWQRLNRPWWKPKFLPEW